MYGDQSSEDGVEVFTEDLSPRNASLNRSWGSNLVGIFHIGGESCDVKLTDTAVTWTSVTASLLAKKSKKKKSKKVTDLTNNDGVQRLLLKDVFAARLKRRRKAGQKEDEGVCAGVMLYSYETHDYNRLREKIVVLESASENDCTEWLTRIERVISGYPNRPRRIRFFLQPHSGTTRKVRMFYRDKVKKLFDLAKVKVDCTEISLIKNHIQQELDKIDDLRKEYDCIVCMGGDGTVSNVVDALLRRTQRDSEVDVKQGFVPAKPVMPIGIIPTGSTNHIISSIQGLEDVTTSVLHIIYGNTQPVDVCSIFHKEKFNRWGFNLQYGFGGNVLKFTNRYTMLGQRKIDAAFLKALTKSKLRPYECDVHYIPSPNASTSHPKDNVSCRTGCNVCLSVSRTSGSPRSSVYTDSLQEYDPLAISGTSSTIIDLTKESPWRSTKGNYLNVALFTVPGPCEMAPQGLSKYTHIADGCMDLVLVRNVTRKEFLRHLKRHGNAKNQVDFPFIECYRVNEVQFRPRLHTTWKHNDHGFSEIDYEMTRVSSRLASISERSLEVIDDHAHHNSNGIEDINELSSEDGDEDVTSRPATAVTLRESNSNDPTVPDNNSSENRVQSAPSSYRPCFQEQEIAKRKKKAREKEMKVKIKDEANMKSVWNIDNELYSDIDLDLKVHPQLLSIYGRGIHPDSDLGENRLTCIPHF